MHYRDGQQPQLGDLVMGQPYNTHRVIVGTVVGLVPGQTSCNLRVAFAEARPLRIDRRTDGGTVSETIPMAETNALRADGAILWAGSSFGDEPPHIVTARVDYGETRAFDLLGRRPDAA